MSDIIGRYIDRDIRIMHFSSPLEFSPDDSFPGSVALLCFQNAAEEYDYHEVTERIASVAPLSVSIFGAHASSIFHLLLLRLAEQPNGKHIMTNLCGEQYSELNECLWTFIRATWPSEERFSEWKYYTVVTFGDNEFMNKAKIGINKALLA